MLNISLALLYLIMGNVGLLVSNYNASSSPIWPPVGIALALAFIFGTYQVLPGIILGVGLLTIESSVPFPSALGLVTSSVLEVALASMILRAMYKDRFQFKTPKEILSFVLIAVALSPFVASTTSVTILYIGGSTNLQSIPSIWRSLFTGDALGILVLTPLFMSFFNKSERKAGFLEAAVLYTSLAVLSYWAFEGVGTRRFLIIPFITWAALRFSFRGVSISTLIVGFIAVWRSTYLWGVFDNTSPEADLLWIQCLAAGAAIVGYFMATVMEAQEDALEKEIELTINKKHKRIAEESLAILDQSLHKSPIAFALVDKEYRYIRINQAMAELHRVEADFHLGKTMRDITPSTAHLIEPIIDNVFNTGNSLMNSPFKGLSEGLLSCYPVRHPMTAEIFAVAVSFQDMAPQLQIQNLLKENQDRLAFAQEAGKIGAFEWDSLTNRILWTTELETIYGIGRGEFGGLYDSWMKWIHPEDLTAAIIAATQVIQGETDLNHEFRIITKNNETRWMLARGRMVRDAEGNNIKFIGINIDLTEQKSIEQKLRLTEANLLHALSVRDEFVAIASHELKTPLTSLKLQIQLYQRGIIRQDPQIYSADKIHSLLEKNSHQIDRLTRLVDDMLDISRMRTGKLSLKKEPCELKSMLLDVLSRTQNQFLECGSGLPVIEHIDKCVGDWDPLRIEQVITNILTNAIRYGRGKPIVVAIKNYQDCVRISVKDQGLGIARSDQEKIFKRYERGLLAREVSGLGIGLFITQQIVEAHGGRIWVESEVNQGSTFFVDLPRSPALLPTVNPKESSLVE